MNGLRKLLIPFGWLYGAVTSVRNLFYDKGIFTSYKIPKKSIVVGNLSAGGTGKTPLVDYITKLFIDESIATSILSRGYGRKTTGVIIASEESDSNQIGDEPLLYYRHYGSKINVVVAEKRKLGVELILNNFPNNELIILDDAFQHRAVSAGLSIIVTQYDHLYCDDLIIPAGNLREFKSGSKRSDIVVVSKCPSQITNIDKKEIIKRLDFPEKNVFFSRITYRDLIPFKSKVIFKPENILLVTGIANPKPLIELLSRFSKVEHLTFKDHHDFTSTDIELIHDKFGKFASRNKIIVTTEKDYMRLIKFDQVFSDSYPWFYQPINIEFDNQELFNNRLKEYVAKI